MKNRQFIIGILGLALFVFLFIYGVNAINEETKKHQKIDPFTEMFIKGKSQDGYYQLMSGTELYSLNIPDTFSSHKGSYQKKSVGPVLYENTENMVLLNEGQTDDDITQTILLYLKPNEAEFTQEVQDKMVSDLNLTGRQTFIESEDEDKKSYLLFKEEKATQANKFLKSFAYANFIQDKASERALYIVFQTSCFDTKKSKCNLTKEMMDKEADAIFSSLEFYPAKEEAK